MGNSLPTIVLGTDRTVVATATGVFDACALFDNGSVKCWGGDDDGELGQGNTAVQGTLGTAMGDDLPPIALGTGRKAVAISAGSFFNCALLDNGSVKCWGRNINGQLGVGDSSARGDEPGEMGDNLPAVNLGAGRTAVAILRRQSPPCAVLDNGSVKCWGNNNSGQLGLGNTTARGGSPGSMGDNLPAVNLGTGRTAVAIAAGTVSTCALLDDGTVKCWGDGSNGTLGSGRHGGPRGRSPGEMGDSLPAVNLGTGRTAVAIARPATPHLCAARRRLDEMLGHNAASSAGRHREPRQSPGQMGDNLPAVNLGTGRSAVKAAVARTERPRARQRFGEVLGPGRVRRVGIG